MYKALLENQAFRKSVDLYFRRQDGQAVTCEDFYTAMRDANEADIANFLHCQEVPATPVQPLKESMFIPVAVGLMDSHGKEMPLTSVYHDGKLETLATGDQPAYTTVLRVTKPRSACNFLEPMFIPAAVGLLDSHGKDMPLTSVYHDGKLESLATGDQPAYTTVLRVM